MENQIHPPTPTVKVPIPAPTKPTAMRQLMVGPSSTGLPFRYAFRTHDPIDYDKPSAVPAKNVISAYAAYAPPTRPTIGTSL
jgi:hypothetical protein